MTETNYSKNQLTEEEISFKEVLIKLKEWFKYLKSKWVIIFFIGLLGGIIGITYALFQRPLYTASVSFALEDEKAGGGLSGAIGLASSLGIDLGTSAGGAFSGGNLIELMKSRTLVERALLNPINKNGKIYSLAGYYLEFSEIQQAINKKENLKTIQYSTNDDRKNFTLQKDSILGEIYKKVVGDNSIGLLSVAQKDKKISIINVDVKSEDELFSKVLAESIVKEVSEFYISTKSKKAKTNVAILQKQVDSIRNELNEAIIGVAISSDNTYNLNPGLIVKKTPATKRQVDVQANSTILTQLVTNLEMAKVTLLKETPLIQIIDKPILPLKKEKVGKLKSLIIGGVLFGFFCIFFFIVEKLIKGILTN